MGKGVELQVSGVVQGVGFRPFVYRLARRYGYTGFVANTGAGVKIRIDQVDDSLEKFLKDIIMESPPLAQIDAIDRYGIYPADSGEFSILASSIPKKNSIIIPPDIALCSDCLRELFDPFDRRYLYPFINCTNCGPRFSIVEGLPYDRPLTSMRSFPMCPGCEAEYQDPASRRFHAQPNSCRQCGPSLSWLRSDSGRIDCLNPPAEAAVALAQGRLVAIRGVGGFHLAADGGSEEAVQKVRLAKSRKAKPLAVMFAGVESLKKYFYVNPEEERLLTSFRRPIILLRKKRDCSLAADLAPGLDEVGVMLPYAPVHYLLFACPEIPESLVMTSANLSGEPICYENRETLGRLADLVDFFLLHNREIVSPLDDSVVRIVSGKTRLIRRSRGYVPEPVNLELVFPDILACGGESKNTFCLVKKDKAFLSQHIGTLSNPGVFNRYQQNIRFLGSLFNVKPELVACDLHPDYQSSRYAGSLGLPLFRIQHHHAHAAAVMAEHHLTEESLAVIMDGAGLGPDNTIWGGEILLVNYAGYQRLAGLQTLPMPGGDLVARELYRMGFAAWWKSKTRDENINYPVPIQRIPEKNRDIFTQMITKGVNTPLTSSCGRLFDAVVSLLDLRQESDYEGQSGMELETLAYRALGGSPLTPGELSGSNLLPVSFDNTAVPAEIYITPMFRELLALQERGYGANTLALEFHIWLISSLSNMIGLIIKNTGHKPIILGGGCFQNTILLQGLEASLKARGFPVYSAKNLPANDGCIALGQAVIAGTLQQSSA